MLTFAAVKHRFARTTMGQKSTLVQGNISDGKGSGVEVRYYRNGNLYGPTKLGPDSKAILGDIGPPGSVCITGNDYEAIEAEGNFQIIQGDVPSSSGDFLDKFMGWSVDKGNAR